MWEVNLFSSHVGLGSEKRLISSDLTPGHCPVLDCLSFNSKSKLRNIP